MKNMNTNEAFDRMTAMLPHVASIVGDVDVREMHESLKGEVKAGELLLKLYPVMLTKHRSDLLALLGIACGKTADEVANMPYAETKKILESVFWGEFFDFFPLFLHMVAKA